MQSHLARLTLTVSLVALLVVCDSDPTNSVTGTGDSSAADGAGSTAGVSSGIPCPNCTFDPKLYTRTTGIPVTEVIEFQGNPDGAYTLETDDLGTQGANSRLWLNGERMKTPDGLHRQDIVLGLENSLEVRLTGKPQSKLQVRVFQEVASVTVTPDSANARHPAKQQFTAMAWDRNDTEIPRQTFTWESADTLIASVDAVAGVGVAKTVGEVHLNGPWSYTTTSTGEGQAQITAHADDSDKQGTATWTVVQGFVYTTYRPPLPARSRAIKPFRYDETRLNQMAATCTIESSNTRWIKDGESHERQFQRCYPSLKLSTPRRKIDGDLIAPSPNVGLYGRYCGEGHPHGEWIVVARGGDHQPKDPIDAVCMEHDRADEHHGLDAFDDALQATCIVRWMIETEELHEEGVRIREDTHPERWDAFWSQWPDMAEAREHWLSTTKTPCSLLTYKAFLDDRNLTKPE